MMNEMEMDMFMEIKKHMQIAYMSVSRNALKAAHEAMETMLLLYPVSNEVKNALNDYYKYMSVGVNG